MSWLSLCIFLWLIMNALLEVNTNFIENIIPCKWYGGFHMTRPNCLVIHICDLLSENQQFALLILVIQWLIKSATVGLAQ